MGRRSWRWRLEQSGDQFVLVKEVHDREKRVWRPVETYTGLYRIVDVAFTCPKCGAGATNYFIQVKGERRYIWAYHCTVGHDKHQWLVAAYTPLWDRVLRAAKLVCSLRALAGDRVAELEEALRAIKK